MVTFYKYWNINPHRVWVREAVAELLGTFFLVFMGNNAVAAKVISNGEGGSFGTIYTGFALGAFLGVLIAAGVSGAHLNPVVTLAGAIVKKVDWCKVPHYIIAQYLGGFLAACCTYLLYIDGFNQMHMEGEANLTTAGIFATYPREGLSVHGGLIDQMFGSMVLVVAVYAILDKKNTNVPLQLVPLYVALVILAIGCSIGINEGYAINPARDFGPRLFTYLTCWGDQVFQDETFWYIPIVATHIGGIIGAYLYVLCIERMRELSAEGEENNEFNIQIVEKKLEDPEKCDEKMDKLSYSYPVSQESYTCRL